MAVSSGAAKSGRGDRRGFEQESLGRTRPRPSASDVVPFGPNAFATFASFIVLITMPWTCLRILETIWEEDVGIDQVASTLILVDPIETFIHAVLGALVFLLIGAVLQTWRHNRPFSSRWPILLAFPLVWGLILPEHLLSGGTLVSGAVVGTAIALAFGVHWGILNVLRDAMD